VPIQKLSSHLPIIGQRFPDNQFYSFAGVCWNETGQQEYYYQSLADVCGFSTAIFGSSGSGKSQLGAGFLATAMYANSPDQLGVIVVDPKLDDFLAFNACPHLITPVIGDIDQAINALRLLVAEMDRRVADKTHVKKRIIFYCDEIADLIAQDDNVVRLLQRICQKGRSLGIGVILATQRAVGSGLGNVLMNISVRCVGRLPSQQESVFAAGVPNVNTSKSRGKGDFLIFSADHDGLQIQGFWFDRPEDICKLIADKWQGKAAHTRFDGGVRDSAHDAPAEPEPRVEIPVELYSRLKQSGRVSQYRLREWSKELLGKDMKPSLAKTMLDAMFGEAEALQ